MRHLRNLKLSLTDLPTAKKCKTVYHNPDGSAEPVHKYKSRTNTNPNTFTNTSTNSNTNSNAKLYITNHVGREWMNI